MARPQERTGKTGSDGLARVVRERRAELGLSRQDLADATGIPYPTIAQIETAYRGVSPARLGVIARVLGLDPKQLYEVLAAEESSSVGGSAPTRVPVPAPAAAPAPQPTAAGWHANPRFAASRPKAMPAAAAAVAGNARPVPRRTARGGRHEVVEQAVELLSQVPVGERIEALSQVQSRVIERLVAERVERSS